MQEYRTGYTHTSTNTSVIYAQQDILISPDNQNGSSAQIAYIGLLNGSLPPQPNEKPVEPTGHISNQPPLFIIDTQGNHLDDLI